MWFKVDDSFHSSRKLLSIPKRHRLAAAGLWVIAGSWCGQQLTDGHVPDYMLKEWGATPAIVKALVDSGLWIPESDANVFHSWGEYQPSKQDVSAERAASRERMRDLRASRKQRKPRDSGEETEVFRRTSPNSSESVRNPDPTRPDPVSKDTEGEASQAPPAPKKRGSRIPEGWLPSNELIQAMRQECPNVDQQMEHRKFVDYWTAQPGAKGSKLDWNATYRNWIRRANEKFSGAYTQALSGSERRLVKGHDLVQRTAAKASQPTLDPFEEFTAPKELNQ